MKEQDKKAQTENNYFTGRSDALNYMFQGSGSSRPKLYELISEDRPEQKEERCRQNNGYRKGQHPGHHDSFNSALLEILESFFGDH